MEENYISFETLCKKTDLYNNPRPTSLLTNSPHRKQAGGQWSVGLGTRNRHLLAQVDGRGAKGLACE